MLGSEIDLDEDCGRNDPPALPEPINTYVENGHLVKVYRPGVAGGVRVSRCNVGFGESSLWGRTSHVGWE